jgi:hypothetical protein
VIRPLSSGIGERVKERMSCLAWLDGKAQRGAVGRALIFATDPYTVSFRVPFEGDGQSVALALVKFMKHRSLRGLGRCR